MKKIQHKTKSTVKKFNLFGVDFSVGIADQWQFSQLRAVSGGWLTFTQDVNFYRDKEEKNGIITHRFVIWKIKLEMKILVERNFVYA